MQIECKSNKKNNKLGSNMKEITRFFKQFLFLKYKNANLKKKNL